MTRPGALLFCLILIAGGFSLSRTAQPDDSHDQWLRERYFEATSIKVGMTRAELMRVFKPDGGLQLLLPTRYVLNSSNMIKVDVEFDMPAGAKGNIVPEDLRREMEGQAFDEKYQYVPNEELKIKSISKPYVEQFNYD